MDIKLKEAADMVGGKIYGNENAVLHNVAKIEEAKKGDLTFLYHPAYLKYFDSTQASAIIVKPDFDKNRKDINYIEVENPDVAFQKIILKYFNPKISFTGIDESASIHPSAMLGKNTALGKNVVISEKCKIGNNSIIMHNTVIQESVTIGDNTIIYPNVTIREKCNIGSRVIIHSGTVIGSDGFGYSKDNNGVYNKIPQIGNVVIEDDVELGSNVSIDRAALGSTKIKKGSKIDNLVQIAHNVEVGENTAISAQTGVSGSSKIGNNCILAGQVGLADHIELGDGIIIGAQSGLSKSLSKPGIYFGYPAKELRTSLRLEAHIRKLPDYSDRIKQLEKKLAYLETAISKNAGEKN